MFSMTLTHPLSLDLIAAEPLLSSLLAPVQVGSMQMFTGFR
jgi:hypothetical protein